MNNRRREKLKEVITLMNKLLGIIEDIKDEEEECYDNLTENLQNTKNGIQMEENIDTLEDISYRIEDIIDDIKNI